MVNPPTMPRLDTLVSFDFRPSIGINARQVDKFGMNIKSFKEPLKRSIQKVMIPSFNANFAAEGRPSWPQLSERTVQTRGEAHPILNRTGRLRKRITQLSIWDIKTESAAIKNLPSDVFYGAYHQAGIEGLEVGELTGTFGETRTTIMGGIPQRQFVMFQEQDSVAIGKVFADWIDERAAAAGLNLRGG